MKLSFSQRLGLKPDTKLIQLDEMDNDLRVALWNSYIGTLWGSLSTDGYGSVSQRDRYINYMWHEYYKLPIDQRPRLVEHSYEFIREKFYKCSWNEVYDFIEFNASLFGQPMQIMTHQFVAECNRVLEREFAGYRIIDYKVVAISNDTEIKTIEEALSKSGGMFNSPYKGVNVHLSKALSKLSGKSPDYSNSIKESISAVESLCRTLTNTKTLGDALNTLASKGITLNPQMKAGIEKLYAYTNNKESGIRHALMESPNLPTFDDAKFMLVTCCAFINFLVAKGK